MPKKAKSVLLAALLMGVTALAWAVTPHREYAAMKIPDCNSCHEASGVAPNHTAFWLDQHRVFAERNPNNCSDCHDRSYCYDCHFGGGLTPDLHKSTAGPSYMPRSHVAGWREIHPIKAWDDPNSCYRCHDEKKFCADCHQRFNPAELTFLSHRRGFRSINVTDVGPNHATFSVSQCPTCHPNSLLPKHEWSRDHAREARKNLKTCQTCHPEGDVCLTCHSARFGLMSNPHPEDWGDIKDRLRRRGNERSCIKCHTETFLRGQ